MKQALVPLLLLLSMELTVAFLPSLRPLATRGGLMCRKALAEDDNDGASSLSYPGLVEEDGVSVREDNDQTTLPLRQPEWSSPPSPTPFARPSDRLKPPGLRDQPSPPMTPNQNLDQQGQQPVRPPASDDRNTRLGGGFRLEKQPTPARLREDMQRDQLLGFFGNSTAMLCGAIMSFLGAAFFAYALDHGMLVNTRDIAATQELYEQARQEARMRRPQVDPENVDVTVVFD